MSIQYVMKIYDRARAFDHLAIREALVAAFSLETMDNHFFCRPEANLLVTVSIDIDEDDPCDPSELAERKALGFSHAGVSIRFRLQRNFDDETMSEMTRMVNWVLERYSGDATFYNDEGIVPHLFRSRDKLVLVDSDFWRCDPALRTLITLPYEYRKASVDFDLTVRRANQKINPMAVANLIMAKFQLSVDLHFIPRRIGEGLILAPFRFDDKRPTYFMAPHDHGENLGIHFEVDVLSYDAGLAKLVTITRWVLEQYDGDAKLEWNPEWNVEAPPLLTRTNNTLTLSDEPDFWTPERKVIMLGKPLP